MRPLNYIKRSAEIGFNFGGAYLVTRNPFFGVTETQKRALQWASWHTPPVICVEHKQPTAPDRDSFYDPNELHRSYQPYAMVVATIRCLGEEEKPRKIKIYFCDVELHEDNAYGSRHIAYKDTYIVPVE